MHQLGWKWSAAVAAAVVWAVWCGPASAAQIWLKDGRILEGKLGRTSGLADVPRTPRADGSGPLQLIWFVDDNLRRTYFSRRHILNSVEEDSTEIFERFRIRYQPVKRLGATVESVGPIIHVEPFTEYGRRILTMSTTRGAEHVIQCITEITPLWTKVEGNTHVWDYRMATSSIPPDTLAKILAKQTDPKDPDERLKVARFYLQSQLYREASRELERILTDFSEDKDLRSQLEPFLRRIKQLDAQRLLDELELRRSAGQHGLVKKFLGEFPSEGVAGSVLERVREMLADYEKLENQRRDLLEHFAELLAQVKDEAARERIEPIGEEIAAELNVNTLGRLATFHLMLADETRLPEEKLALAISGWLMGSSAATEKLPVALSAWNVRELICEYLNAGDTLTRARVLEYIRPEEAGIPSLLAKILSHMKPPVETLPPGVVPEPPADQEDSPADQEDSPADQEDSPADAPPVLGPPSEPKADAAAPAAAAEPSAELEEAKEAPAPPPGTMPGYYELEVAGLPDAPAVRYVVQLPPEYDPYLRYPTILSLHGAGSTPQQQITWWAGAWTVGGWRKGQAARRGYIVVAPGWASEHQKVYRYSAREHAAVLNCLRDACRRFAVDTDRVFLTGHSMGGDAAWDIGLAHPDLWAGVIPIVARSGRYCTFYSQNAKLVPFYFVCGEFDGDKMVINARNLDRYIERGYNCTVVEYLGRGHEFFFDEIQRLFDWMGRYKRNFYPKEFSTSTMRPWDNFFFWVELDQLPPKAMVAPVDWPPPRGTQAVKTEGTLTVTNGAYVTTGAGIVRVWLSPEMLDFDERIDIKVNGQRMIPRAEDAPNPLDDLDLQRETILEDVRTRADRQHPFWIKLESPTGRVAGRRG